MEITGNITEQGQTTGVRIQDGETTYCVKLDLLTCKLIFNGLIESGYAYVSYPFGFTKDGKTIQDLENIPYESLSEEEKHDSMIPPGESEYMSELELRAALPNEDRYIKLGPKNEIPIKTRDEFISFLLSTPASAQIADNPQSYLPLNYLVSDEALFTHSEYFNKRNEKYRELIERREKLSFECYRRLVDWMMEVGVISPDFTALDFKRGYYSWGVPGIQTQLLSVKEESVDVRILHSTVTNNEKTSAAIHCFGRDGKMNPPLLKGQILTADQNWIDEQIKMLEPDELYLVTSRCPVKNKVITMECAEFTLEFDEHNRRIQQREPASEHVTPILQIRSAAGGELDVKYFNTVRQEIRDAYWKDIVFSACVEHLIQKTTVETDKSSFKAIQEGLSLSPAAAIRYIIACLALRENHHVDLGHEGPIDGNDEDSAELLNAYQAAYQFLPDMLSVHPEDFDIHTFSEVFGADPFQVSDIIDSIMSGDQNIDDIESGYIADRSVSSTAIRSVIDFAAEKMGYSVNEIIDAVIRFDPHTDACLSFQKEGVGKLKTLIPVRRRQEAAYDGEVLNYKALSASTALSWHYVLAAMAEPGKNAGRHCAARILVWTHRKTSDAMQPSQPKIENTLRELVLGSIEALTSEFERNMAIRCADIVVANMLFEARLNRKQEFTLPPFFGGKTVIIPDETLEEIRRSKNFDEKLESTFGLSDHAVDGGDIHFHFVNARITPHHIIPNKGVRIDEIPFLPLWWNPKELPDYNERYMKCFPEPDFEGYGGKYYVMSVALPSQENANDEDPSLNSPYSLRNYYRALETYHAEAIEKKDHHILTPPSLAEIAQPYFYKKRSEIPCEATDFLSKWIHSPPRTLTRDNAKTEDDIGGNLLEEVRPCVSWVKGFTLDDYTQLPQEVAYDIFSACGDRIKAVQYLGDSVRFMDGYTHNFRESDIDNAKYAVFNTSGGTYIPFLNGKIAKTDSRAFGG